MTKENIFGPEGDYYTSPYTHRLFSQCLADAFAHYFQLLARQSPFHLVELGIGEGRLGHDILTRLQETHLGVFNEVRYYPVEAEDDLPDKINGIVFSNEFFDALPVHRVRARDTELREIYVYIDEVISEIEGEITDPRIMEYMRMGFKKWKNDHEYEVNLRMIDVLEDLDRRIDSAIVLTVDYGYTWEEYQTIDRPQGTLLCYYRHQAVKDPYINLCDQDITAHVNFEVMTKVGETLGWRSKSLTTQRRFLHEWGLEKHLIEEEAQGILNSERVEERLGLGTLLRPGGISDTMKVLVQEVRI